MNQPVLRNATYEDLFGLPNHIIGEILHGQLISRPRSVPRHVRASSIIGG